MSGDIFKKAFWKSVDEERQRNIKIEKDGQIREEKDRKHDEDIRRYIEDIKGDVESVISQIPSVFEVSVESFDKDIRFWVHIPEDDSRLHVEISLAGFPDWDLGQEYAGFISTDKGDQIGKDLAMTDPWLGREEIGKWLGSELGRILGEEYERHRDFYEKMEKGQ